MYNKQKQIEENTDVDNIIKEELLRDEDKIISIQKGKNFDRMEITQQLDEVPDPRIHGAKIIFDSRLDEFSNSKDNARLINDLNKQSYPKITLQDKKDALLGKSEEEDEDFNEETSKISFKKKDAEADTGEKETYAERIRNMQQRLINFKRELAELNIPIEF